jgi:uncharacterized protein
MNFSLQPLIEKFDLRPHPEGGFYRETYRSVATTAAGRSVCTAIYYLLPAGERSQFHRIDADEIWHFYAGDPLRVVELREAGAKVTLLSAENPQHVVPAGTWFGAIPAPQSRYSLVGCTVSPAFEFAQFELGDPNVLLLQFPAARELILQFVKAPVSA